MSDRELLEWIEAECLRVSGNAGWGPYFTTMCGIMGRLKDWRHRVDVFAKINREHWPVSEETEPEGE
jgi:hypothetical protein